MEGFDFQPAFFGEAFLFVDLFAGQFHEGFFDDVAGVLEVCGEG